jgi:hypothetical protein
MVQRKAKERMNYVARIVIHSLKLQIYPMILRKEDHCNRHHRRISEHWGPMCPQAWVFSVCLDLTPGFLSICSHKAR